MFHFHSCLLTFTPSCLILKLSHRLIAANLFHYLRLECVVAQNFLIWCCSTAPCCHLVESWCSPRFQMELKASVAHVNPLHPSTLTKPTALFPHPGNNRTFSQLLARAKMDQNTNKERRRGLRKDCLVWKPAELIEECGIMKLLVWLFDIWSTCFFFPPRFISHLYPPFPLLSLCLTVGVGALDLEGDTRLSALGRLSHNASLKRGGSLRTPRSNSEYHTTSQTLPHNVLEGLPCLSSTLECGFICLCVLHFYHVQWLGETQYKSKRQLWSLSIYQVVR